MSQLASFDADEYPRFWFVIDLAIGREHGVPLLAPPPGDVSADRSPNRVAGALLDALACWDERVAGGEDRGRGPRRPRSISITEPPRRASRA
jgi:hypothetical protein